MDIASAWINCAEQVERKKMTWKKRLGRPAPDRWRFRAQPLIRACRLRPEAQTLYSYADIPNESRKLS